mmetsp:Transcript_23307/g.88389  ORF Transcript_23307/g.88389 Transcript_23307/m.88389 type:complete len:268 (+) Transcript_23307:3011-3814(+)
MALSPSLIIVCAPSLKVFCSRMGSIIGSSSSSTLSKRNGWPYCTAISRWRMKSESRNVAFLSPVSRREIQPTACCWGSMHSGKREARVVKMPFITEWESAGRPSPTQRCTSASVTMKSTRSKGVVSGRPSSAMPGSQTSSRSVLRNSNVKAPRYDRKPAERQQSPTRRVSFSARRCSSSDQRPFSDPSPLMRRLAASSCCSIRSASCSRCCFSPLRSSNSAWNSASCDSSRASLSRTSSSCSSARSFCSSMDLTLALSGSTSSATFL